MMALIGMADLVVLLVSLHSSSHSSSLMDLLLSPPIVRATVYFLAPCVALVVGGTVLMVDREAATTRKRTSFGSASSGGRQSRSTTLDYSNNAYQSLHLILNDSGHLLDSSTLSRPSYTDDDDDEDDDVAAGDRAPLVAAPIEGTAPNVAVPLVVGDDTDDHDDDDKQHAHGKATDRLAADEEEEERDNTWDDWLRVGRVLWTQRSPFAAAFLSSTISGVLQLFSNSWIGATVGIVTDAGPTSRGSLSTHSRAPRHKAKARVSHRCMPLLAAEDRVYELIQSTVLLVSLYIVMATAYGIRNTLFHAITERVSAKLRIDAFSSLLTQPVRVYPSLALANATSLSCYYCCCCCCYLACRSSSLTAPMLARSGAGCRTTSTRWTRSLQPWRASHTQRCCSSAASCSSSRSHGFVRVA